MDRVELNKVLNLLKPGLDKTASIESMMYFFFSGKEIVTYNSQIAIHYPFKTGIKCFVNAKKFMSFISKLRSDEISLELKNKKLHAKSTGVNAAFSTIFDEEVVERIKKVTKSINDIKWKSLPSNFIDSISLCSFAASRNDSDGTLTCIHIKDKNISACNNTQIATSSIENKMKELLIPVSCVKDLLAMEPISYSISKVWVHFKNKEGCVFSIRKIIGSYPDFSNFFSFKGKKVKLPKDIVEGIDIVSVFTDDIKPNIVVEVENNKCVIIVKSDTGKIRYTSKVKYDGDLVTFTINPEFLNEMISHSSTIKVDESKAMIESGDFKIVTALMITE